jgi:hypothetical protein
LATTGALSDFLEKKFLDHLFGNTAYTAPATLYLGAFTSAPTDAGGGTELAIGTNGYARASVANNTTNFPNQAVNVAKSYSNGSTAITFPTCTTADWGSIVACAWFDASSAGNMLVWGTLTVPKTIQVGDTLTFPAGTFTLALD